MLNENLPEFPEYDGRYDEVIRNNPCMGGGATAQAYKLDDNRVLRVMKLRRRDYVREPYIRYIRRILENRKLGIYNLHTPLVYSHEEFEQENDVFVFTVLELLVPTSNNGLGSFNAADTIRDMFYGNVIKVKLSSQMDQMHEDGIITKYSDIKAVKKIVVGISKKYKAAVDMHAGNVMWRGKVPVITDPLVI